MLPLIERQLFWMQRARLEPFSVLQVVFWMQAARFAPASELHFTGAGGTVGLGGAVGGGVGGGTSCG